MDAVLAKAIWVLLVIIAMVFLSTMMVTTIVVCIGRIGKRLFGRSEDGQHALAQKTRARAPAGESDGTSSSSTPIAQARQSRSAASVIEPVSGPLEPTQPQRQGFLIRVAGVSFHNSNGQSRQEVLRQLRPGDPVRLQPEPDNPFDPDAIRIVTPYGQLGYVPRPITPWIGLLDREKLQVHVHSIKRFDRALAGCLVMIDPGEQPAGLLSAIEARIRGERSSAWLAGLRDETRWESHGTLSIGNRNHDNRG